MKNTLLFIGGLLSGAYTLAAVWQQTKTLTTHDPSTTFGATNLAASIAVACLGAAVCVACFAGVWRKAGRK